MSRCNLQATTNGFLIYKPSQASASIIHLYDECVLSTRACFCLYTKIKRIPKAGGFFSGDGTFVRANKPGWISTRISCQTCIGCHPAVRRRRRRRGRRVLLLVILQNQHGGRGTASEARREPTSDASDI